ncbi:glycine zipper domain-containing protein [Opitutus terrae]|uniref:DUF883 domain-containing protein n=1 Tax=Opitutus terrae (strain DSM 11246 / JCM 15787 / PB90-1) TaxID=452637 RepID=B1ZUP6_OPITP|nr:DUF883 family protein [Opitutus terrae]ACB74930.1 protein of unknown function DUF883 ElaB [Opitutus terrae PB90-1]
MKNDSGTATETPEQIVEHISRLMAEAEAMLEGPVSGHGGEKLNKLRAQFESLQAKASSAYGEARDKVVAGAKSTDQVIRQHPYEALAIALGVGVLLGVLIRRND